MAGYAAPIRRLIKELCHLPGVGERTAVRLATFIIHYPGEDARRLAESILDVKDKIRLCSRCYNLTEQDVCEICRDASRDRETICVVEEPDVLVAVEECAGFRGTYHILHGALSPLEGIGPEHLRIKELLDRIAREGVKEVIIATNPNAQGEATALLVMKLLKGTPVRVSRIAFGVPVGGDLRYTDRMTLAKSLEFRRCM
jgi:recombination protein RecR